MRAAPLLALSAALALYAFSRQAQAAATAPSSPDWTTWPAEVWGPDMIAAGGETGDPYAPIPYVPDYAPGPSWVDSPPENWHGGMMPDDEIPPDQLTFGDDYGEGWDVAVPAPDPEYFFAPVSAQQSPAVQPVNLGSAEANISAFLALIREFESRNQYDVVYGGRRFYTFDDHPRIFTPINLPGYQGLKSSAAGAYQFIWRTWRNLKARLGLPDFSPASQDAAAVELLREVGALPYIEAGDFDSAMRAAASQWASLPYSPAKQNPRSIQAANTFLTTYIGRFA